MHEVMNAQRYYKTAFPDLPLKETSVRRFKNAYQENLKKRMQDDNTDELKELPSKKMGTIWKIKLWDTARCLHSLCQLKQ